MKFRKRLEIPGFCEKKVVGEILSTAQKNWIRNFRGWKNGEKKNRKFFCFKWHSEKVKKPSLAKSKIVLVLRVYSMEGFKPQVINNIDLKIKEQLTSDSIRCFANVFVKSTQIRFSPADIDYLSEIDRKMVRNICLWGIFNIDK